jgi:dihydrofolate synthase/folylpolyglutamate synthase
VTLRDRLFALEAFGIKLGLDNMRVLVAALGHPERAYPTVHVAGTNGKGSVSAMVERGLRAGGHRTGLYTSPHLDRPEERIAVDGAPITADAFDAAAVRVFEVVDEAGHDGRLSVTPTFFEVTTAMAFEAFRAAHVDVAVIEVGLGGRFDATNVVVPTVTAITSIALDHERHLGSTIAAIAGEKAGIAKAGVTLVVGDLPPDAARVVESAARAVGAPISEAAGALGMVGLHGGRAHVQPHSARWPEMPDLTLSLAGRHQAGNAAVALRLLETLDGAGIALGASAARLALSDTRWPARLEWLRVTGGRLLVDAAHNPAGAHALASYLQDAGLPRLPIVLAAMQDKDVGGMVRPLTPVASRFVATTAATSRALSPDALAARIRAALPDTHVITAADPEDAVTQAIADAGAAVVAGSIFLVGPLRARLLRSGATPI